MSHADASSHRPGHRFWEYIRANANELQYIPDPDTGWWEPGEVHELHEKTPSLLFERGFLDRRPTLHGDCFEYKTNEGTYVHIQHAVDERDTLPCGHTGISNLGDGDFTCGFDGCDAVHDRATMEEVYGDG